MPYLKRADISLYYEDYGAGYPIFCMAPGSLESSINHWRTSAPFDPTQDLANAYRVIVMDQRNAGQSWAPITAADGCLYIRYADGTMVLAEANPKAYREISSFKIPDSGSKPSWSHPVVCNGRLYLREQDRILCYDIKANGSGQ